MQFRYDMQCVSENAIVRTRVMYLKRGYWDRMTASCRVRLLFTQ